MPLALLGLLTNKGSMAYYITLLRLSFPLFILPYAKQQSSNNAPTMSSLTDMLSFEAQAEVYAANEFGGHHSLHLGPVIVG